MRWIIEFVIRYRAPVSFLFMSMLCIWMISASRENQAKTARALTFSIFYPLQFTLSQIDQVHNIFAENNRLRKEVVELSAQVAQFKEQTIENDRLRGLLSFSKEFSYQMVPVRVIAHDPSPVYKSIIIDAGKNQGVQMWMPVVGEKGVVGKVVQVMGNLSLVQLLKDPTNRTSVMDRRTRSVSILETENSNDFFFQSRSHEDVKKGDTIVTSGLGGIYPHGLQVGIVTSVEQMHDPLFNKVKLDLSVEFDHLEELFVMRLSPQWSAFHAELDSVKGP